MHTAEQLVASSVNLVTPPVIFAKVKALVDDPDSTAGDLATAIATDPAMTASPWWPARPNGCVQDTRRIAGGCQEPSPGGRIDGGVSFGQ